LAQADLGDDDHVIEALACGSIHSGARRARSTMASTVRSGRLRRACRHGGRNVGERAITIVHEIPWRLVLQEGVPELLRDPAGGRIGRDLDVHDASAVMGEDDQHEP